jgi:16S rRNA C967 or C1407 C5-methylase (RsmB/RsmF family)
MKSEFKERLKYWLGEAECEAFLRAIKEEIRPSVRLNTTQAPPPFLPLGETVPWCRSFGHFWLGYEAPSRHPAYLGGAYYIQEASAMLAVSALKDIIGLKGARILDLAAAPGGKTTQAAELADQGLVVANEVDQSRRQALIWNILRHRIDNTLVTGLQAHTLARMLPGFFDVVLLDAPCSGEGLMAKGQTSPADWGISRVKRLAALQRQLLLQARTLLKPGGTLVYSTCTFSPEENEEQVLGMIKNGMEPLIFPAHLPASPPLSDQEGVQRCSRRLWPHRHPAAGAFVAILRRPDNDMIPSPDPVESVLPEQARLPWSSTLTEIPLYQKRGILSYLPFPHLPRVLFDAAIQLGTPICDVPRGRQPQFGSHRFFPSDRILDLTDDEAARYHRGESAVEPPSQGFWVLRWRGLPLGLVEKTQAGTLSKLPRPLLLCPGQESDSMRSSSK